jgi:hypothetical protein
MNTRTLLATCLPLLAPLLGCGPGTQEKILSERIDELAAEKEAEIEKRRALLDELERKDLELARLKKALEACAGERGGGGAAE